MYGLLDCYQLMDTLNVDRGTMKSIMAKPCNKQVVRIRYFKEGDSYHVFDDSDNTEGYHVLSSEKALRTLIASIEQSASTAATISFITDTHCSEVDILAGVKNESLRVTDLDSIQITSVPAPQTGWTHDLLVKQAERLKIRTAGGANAFLGGTWVGSTEV